MTEPMTKKRRWLPWLLFPSLALNILVIGLVIGAIAFRGDGPKDRYLPNDPRGIYLSALDFSDKREIGKRLRARPEMREMRRRSPRENVEQAIEVLRVEPYDTAAFLQVLGQVNDQRKTRDHTIHGTLAQYLDEQGPEFRKAYADALEEQLEDAEYRFKKYRKRHHDDDDHDDD